MQGKDRTMIWEVYAYGDGDTIVKVLTAAASIVGGADFPGIAKTTVIMAFFLASIQVVFKGGVLQQQLKWVFLVATVSAMMINAKQDVKVVDKLNASNTRVVNNVPAGLAIFAGGANAIGNGMLQLYETAMSIPGDRKYEKNGMLFGTKLLNDLAMFEVQNQDLKKSLGDFGYQCIVLGMAHGFVSADELLKSNNIWNIAKTKLNQKSRHFSYWEKDSSTGKVQRKTYNCKAGVTKLENEWANIENEAKKVYGPRLYKSMSNSAAQAQLLTDIPVLYTAVLGVSTTAKDAMQQAMLINAIQTGGAARATSESVQQTFLQNRITITERLKSQGFWEMAARKASSLYAILQAFLIAMFPVVVLLSFVIGFTAIKSYASVMLMVQCLPTYWAVVNTFSITNENDTYKDFGSSGLSYITQPDFVLAHQDLSSTAGIFASAALPAILMLFKGVSAMSGMVTNFAMNGMQTAGSVASSVAEGNISMANTSYGNHNAFNTGMSQHSMGGSYANNMTTTGLMGQTTTTAPVGNQVTGALQYNMPFKADLGNSVQHAINAQQSENTTAAFNTGSSYFKQFSNAENFSQNIGDNSKYGHSKAYGDAWTQAEKIGETTGLTTGQVMSAAMAMKADASLGLGNKFLEGLLGVNGSLSGSLGTDFRTEENRRQTLDMIKEFSENKSFTETYDATRDVTASKSYNEGYSYDKGLRENLDATFSKAESFAKSVGQTDTNSMSWNTDATADFVRYARANGLSESDLLATGTNTNRDIMMQRWADSVVDNMLPPKPMNTNFQKLNASQMDMVQQMYNPQHTLNQVQGGRVQTDYAYDKAESTYNDKPNEFTDTRAKGYDLQNKQNEMYNADTGTHIANPIAGGLKGIKTVGSRIIDSAYAIGILDSEGKNQATGSDRDNPLRPTYMGNQSVDVTELTTQTINANPRSQVGNISPVNVTDNPQQHNVKTTPTSFSNKNQESGNTGVSRNDFSQATGSGMDNFLKTSHTGNQFINAMFGLELPTQPNPNPKGQADNIIPIHASTSSSQQQSVYDATTSFSNKQHENENTDKSNKITFGNLVRKQWD